MPDDQQLEPISKAEPVVVGDIADLVIYVAGTLGVLIPDDVAAKVVAAVVAVVLWVQTTYFKRRAVTPVARADVREADAYDLGVAQGEATVPPHATVVQVGANSPPQSMTFDFTGDPEAVAAALKAELARLKPNADEATSTTSTSWERMVPRPEPLVDPIPPAPTRVPPPAGLD